MSGRTGPAARSSPIERERARVFRLLKQRPKLTVPALQRALAAEGVTVSAATAHAALPMSAMACNESSASRGAEGGRRTVG